jgi:DNA (cytosine-5)-methyltransferase 1
MASEFGVPQNRKRAFFVGIKGNKEFVFPNPTNPKLLTSKEAISDLPEYSIVDGSEYPMKPKSEYQELLRENSTGVYNHQITVHNEQTIEIIAMVPDGGNYKNLPVELHQTRKVNIAWTRLNSKKPSFTIDTGHNHHFHYKFNRVPTARESARLQSFPDNFIFRSGKTSQLKQIGNAVPPLLAKILAENLIKYI